MSLAFVFPGQGSQSIGMLSALGEQEPAVRRTFAGASDVLGYDLWTLAQQGPEERLNATEVTQPLMLAAGVAVWRVWQAHAGPVPNVVAGHSLGEFTALVCAQALDFPVALELVRFRGRSMQEAVPSGTGGMMAVMGLEDREIEAACAEAGQGSVVEPANFNCPGQVVIAGENAALARAADALKARGAKRVLPLRVSAPFHCSLMRSAGHLLGARLMNVELRPPGLRFVSSVDAQLHADPADIKLMLVRQVSAPVRWTETVRALVASGVTRLVECGPGKVLTGLNRRIEKRPDIECASIDDPESVAAALGQARAA